MPQRAIPRAPSLPPLVQGEIEVDYTPMTMRELGDAFVLTRIVSLVHEWDWR